MIRKLLPFLALLFFSVALHAQQSFPNPVRSGPSLPATCTPGGLVPAWFLLTAGGPIATPYYCSATNTWTAASGGGGASPGGATPQLQSKNGAAFAGVANSGNYPAGIPDPMATPVCSTTGMAGATDYQYVIVEITPVGWTLPSPACDIPNGNATLDGTNFNNITVFTNADTNVFCLVVRSVGPNSPASYLPVPCNGSTQLDQGVSNFVSVAGLPGANTTAGLVLPGGIGVGTFSSINSVLSSVITGVPVPEFFGSGLGAIDWLGNLLSFMFVDPLGDWLLKGQNSQVAFGAGGFWQNVETATNGTSPYLASASVSGFIKCDTADGNVTVNLPDTTTLPFTNFNTFGRILVVHKPKAANTCTIATTDGTLIDGAATYVLNNQFDSVSVYWDADGDGNLAGWATSGRLSFNKILGIASLSQLPAGAGLTANPLSQFATTTSAQLRGVISDESGSGVALFSGTPVTNIAGAQASLLRGTSGTLMGALTIGACNTTTVAITGATTAMPVAVSPVSNPDSGATGLVRWDGYVSSANTVTVRECGLGVVTPNATAYNVAVIQ